MDGEEGYVEKKERGWREVGERRRMWKYVVIIINLKLFLFTSR